MWRGGVKETTKLNINYASSIMTLQLEKEHESMARDR